MNDNHQELNNEGLSVLSNFDENSPVFMMNYLQYKGCISETGKSGKETYKAYMEAAIPFFLQIQATIIFKGKPLATIIGDKEAQLWDEVLIVKYASKNEFFKLLQMKEYPSALRASALSNSKLIFCK
ncbi:MAG: Uncharacterised protein [Polaribacter sp. SA4-10]|nr:MAG: Uncharacterised protein [Polaribacter sp. SA4-10]